MDVQELVRQITPTRTTLLFGAGASIPSGALTGSQLARKLARHLNPEPEDADLSEVAQLLENRKGRPFLVEKVRDSLIDLKPTAGLLTLPDFDWHAIYTTNYDTLVEQAYRKAGRSLEVYRSNYDVTKPRGEHTPLVKIHGCVTQDTADGHKSRMIITESDYDDYRLYRQTLFNGLTQDMSTCDTVIVGQSLSDRHLKDQVKQIIGLRSQGVATRIFLIVHQYQPDRAELYTRLGIEVIAAGLDQFLLELMDAGKTSQTPAYSTSTEQALLSHSLVLTTTDVQHATSLSSSVTKLFNGSPASYADIKNGLTFNRTAQKELEASLTGVRGHFNVIAGARGVGKTTLARSFLLEQTRKGLPAWEHKQDAILNVDAWVEVEKKLKLSKIDGFLLIDDCSRHLKEVNNLVDKLSALDRPNLRLVMTVDAAKWKVARKAQGLFARGSFLRLSVLARADLEELVALLDRRPEIKQLVEQRFLALGRAEKLARLRNKCSSEMFVCLKNIFANDNLDDILLQEYFSLSEESREVYRYVAAVQSLGGHVHRQLIVRLLGLSATGLDATLSHLEGIVFERSVDSRQGIYGWETRHDVIATIISRLKFADQGELEQLFTHLIDNLNPTIKLEIDTAIALATEDMGIARLTNLNSQISILRKLIEIVPSHHTPRRRLAKLFLSHDMLAEANHEIATSLPALGPDPVMQRYKAQSALRRAETILMVEDSDRLAMLLDAENIIRGCINRFGADMYSYSTLGNIGLALAGGFGEYRAIDDAMDLLTQLEASNGDPQIQVIHRALHDKLRRVENTNEVSPSGVGKLVELLVDEG
ncbi:SIR2 family NAD-dependent protein deacylase [Arthrobacter sp. TmT3-37]